MVKLINSSIRLLNIILVCLTVNSYVFLKNNGSQTLITLAVIFFIIANILPSLVIKKFPCLRLHICYHGAECLKVFVCSTLVSVIYHIVLIYKLFPNDWKTWLLSAGICFLGEAIVFWNGMICVYLTSVQLGLRTRVLGLVFGMVPIAHLIMLGFIISVVSDEVKFECEKDKINNDRKNQQICKTKYPLLLVHGVFFRDYKYINYWGRIPDELRKNGAVIYFGNQKSAASVKDSGEELAERIRSIVKETGYEKVNVIAHSKGGLDIRYAMSYCDISPYIASVTTINTPHRGCEFAEYLLNKIPVSIQNKVSNTYNATMRKLGEENPDFMAAVNDLTYSACVNRDKEMLPPENVFCQSVGSKLNRTTSGKFPLNFSYHLVKHFDGPNDGLVSEKSFEWGEKYTFLTVPGTRGISHGDVVDMNRENIPGFDVREFYVQIVNELREKGL